ncbi:hypothetical protein [Corynebacterium sp. NML120713]|uniref:VG15 protein n=1 Tax=Corynebacterium sp. NML120713 TaxID=1906332 RepID=UPI0008FB8D03|nr:hypothetical protein [Corynebacterium sp. NML120713]OIR43200.1 hypothetical protein BJP06_06365 [Corynebacterium sp. NML120713]
MNLNQMEEETREITRQTIRFSEELLAVFAGQQLTPSLWERILELLFGTVRRSSELTARVAREFFDSERAAHFPGVPRLDVKLAIVSFDQFFRDMQGIPGFQIGADITPEAIHRATLRIARTVENSGRWTTIRALETPDPWVDGDDTLFFEDKFTSRTLSSQEYKEMREAERRTRGGVRGWARVPTGRETCAWCLMLCSRGAAYTTARAAGARLTDDQAVRLYRQGLIDPKEHMTEWHDGCDCKLVPVFDLQNWPGKERADAAYSMWAETTAGYYGNDAVNAFRRAVYAGKTPDDY